MRNSIKKSFLIIRDNPLITLIFVIYLIILFTVIQAVVMSNSKTIASILCVLILFLTTAFLSGWFGMMKTAIVSFKNNKTIEERVEDIGKLKNSFFSSVYEYLAPVTTGFIMFILLVLALSSLSSHLFNGLNEVTRELNTLYVEQGNFNDYLINLPEDTKISLVNKMIFSILTTGVIQFTAILYAAVLYFNKENSKNPFMAVLKTISAILHMPVTSIIMFILMTFIFFFLTVIQTSFSQNTIITFITMILCIYFIAYIIVLIFDLYDKNIAHHNNNRTNCFRENESCNTSSN